MRDFLFPLKKLVLQPLFFYFFLLLDLDRSSLMVSGAILLLATYVCLLTDYDITAH